MPGEAEAAPTIYVGNQNPKQDETVTSNGSTTPVPTQREDDLAHASDVAQEQQDAVGADIVKQEQAAADAAKAQDSAEASAAQAEADQAKADEERVRAAHAQAQSVREHALAEYDDAAKKVSGFKYEDFFAGREGTSRKVKAGLAILAGGFGAGLQNAGAALLGQAGHYQNTAAEAVNRAIDKDFEKQKEQLAADRDALVQKGVGLDKLNAFVKQHEMDIESERLLAKERTLAEAKSEMIKAGVPAKDIERRVGILRDKLKLGEDKEKFLNDQRHLETAKFGQKQSQRQVMTYAPLPNTAGADQSGPKNEAQQKAQSFGTSMANGLSAMSDSLGEMKKQDVEALNASRAGWINQLTSGQLSEAFVKSERQKVQDAVSAGRATPAALKYFDGMTQYVYNKLRQESGAAIGKDEAAAEVDRTMINVGESRKGYAERLKQFALPTVQNTLAGGFKGGTNAQVVNGISQSLDRHIGGAKPAAPTATAAAAAKPGRPGPGAIVEAGGKRYRVGSDGNSLTEVR